MKITAKRIASVLCIAAVMLSMAGCCLVHKWEEATCAAPKTCSRCGETEGEALAHTVKAATCEEPSSCSVCGKLMGARLGHKWESATCSKAKTCKVCGKTEGDVAEHDWSEATCTEAAECSVCGKENGKPKGHQRGQWVVIKEPNNGPGKKAVYCTRCKEMIEEKTYTLPYFGMTFNDLMSSFNSQYSSSGFSMVQTSGGFEIKYYGSGRAIVFHDDLNKSSSGATAYSTQKLDEFNYVKIRMFHDGTTIDADYLTVVAGYGGMVGQVLFNDQNFTSKVFDNGDWVSTGARYKEFSYENDSYRFELTVRVDETFYSQVYYEVVIQKLG